MTDEQAENELVNLSAARFGVPLDVLESLLSLERNFDNFSVFGAKTEFSRQVARILDEASNQPGE